MNEFNCMSGRPLPRGAAKWKQIRGTKLFLNSKLKKKKLK